MKNNYILILTISLFCVTGCANQKQFDLAGKKIKAQVQVQTKIIDGFYGLKKAEVEAKAAQDSAVLSGKQSAVFSSAKQCRLPKPEGSGVRITCSIKCGDDPDRCNPDSECAWDCPLEWSRLCVDEEGINKMPEELSEDPAEDIFEDEDETAVIERLPKDKGSAEAIVTGDNNTVVNVIGSSGVVVNGGGGGHNGNTGASPVEQAMAQLLLREVAPVKTDFQEGKEAVLDVVDKVAPWVTGAVIAKEVGRTIRATAGDHGSGNNIRTSNTAADGSSYATSGNDQGLYRHDDRSDNSTHTAVESGQIGDANNTNY